MYMTRCERACACARGGGGERDETAASRSRARVETSLSIASSLDVQGVLTPALISNPLAMSCCSV
jgi:hypothetical protein